MRVAGLDDVVGLEVAVEQALRVQVRERGEDLDDVRDRLVGRERVVLPAVRRHAVLEDLLERPAADVLHDDVAGAVEAGEVVDLEDERVLHLGEELALGDRGFERVRVAGVQQALEHDVALGHVVVAGEVDPAEPAVRDAADDFVLAADDVAGVQLRREGVRGAALRAEALGAAGLAVARPPDRRAARRAEPLLLGHRRVRRAPPNAGPRPAPRERGDAGAEVLDAVRGRDQPAGRSTQPGARRADRGARELHRDARARGPVGARDAGRSRAEPAATSGPGEPQTLQ